MSNTPSRRPQQTMALTMDELRREEGGAGLPFVRSEGPASVQPPPAPPPSSFAGSPASLGETRISQAPSPFPPPLASYPPAYGLGSTLGSPLSSPLGSPLSSPLGSPLGSNAHHAIPIAPAPPPSPYPVVAVALPSARAFSDEAADTVRRGSVKRREKSRYPLERRSLVDRLGIDSGLGPRLRRTPDFSEILLEHRRRRSSLGALANEAPSDGDREDLDVLTICSFAPSISMRELREVQGAALQSCDRLEVPLGMVRGKLTPSLDPTAALQALVAMAQPLVSRDKRAQAVHAAAEDSLAGLAAASWRGFERLAAQLDVVLASLGLPSSHATDTVTRKLLEERAFRRKSLLGKLRLRAEFDIDGSAVVMYLPETAADYLPLLPSFPAAAIVELRPREDASETASESLLALAVTRILGSAPGG